MNLIDQREGAIDSLRHLLPSPRGVVQRRRATRALLLSNSAAEQLRQSLADLVSEIRWLGARIVEAVQHWRSTLRKRYTYFGSMDQRSITFFHEGQNYLRKMCTDLRFLPLPVEQDPLLLHWFGDQLPWLLEKDESLRSSCYGLSQAIMDVPDVTRP